MASPWVGHTRKGGRPRKVQRALPPVGVPAEDILGLMGGFKRDDDSRWKDGQESGTVYHGEEGHRDLLNSAYSMFDVSNPLHGSTFPSVVKFEAEMMAIAKSLLGGGDDDVCGCVLSGGTESILMSAKTHRQWAESRGVPRGAVEFIVATSAHAAIDKACDILQVKLVRVPVDPVTMEMDVAATRAAITPNTAMIYASAPNYPTGVMDPIGALSELALQHGVGLHVDACLGGFYLPFARRMRDDIPAFDFALPGVTAMSCDTHKYGYASKGTSVVLYRNAELRQHQFFFYPEWSGGSYATPGTAGSRPGGLSAAAWASLMRLGDDGFMRITRGIMGAVQKFIDAVHDIDGLFLLGDPKAMVVAFGSREFDVYRVAKAMSTRGYHLAQCQHPACVHIAFTHRHVAVIETLVAALRESAAEVRAAPQAAGAAASKAGVYGGSGGDAVAGGDGGLGRWLNRTLDMPPLKPPQPAAARL